MKTKILTILSVILNFGFGLISPYVFIITFVLITGYAYKADENIPELFIPIGLIIGGVYIALFYFGNRTLYKYLKFMFKTYAFLSSICFLIGVSAFFVLSNMG